MAGLRIDGGDHPVGGDLAGDPPRSRPLAWLDVLAGDQRQQRDRLTLLGAKLDIGHSVEHGQCVVDQPRHQRLGGLKVVPGAHWLAWTVVVVGGQLDLTGHSHQPADPADRRDQLGDGVLGGDRILQDRGVQHPPTPPLEHPGLLHDLTDRLEDPPGPRRRADAVAPVHQHRGVKPLVVQPQPAGHLPGDVAPQRADRLPVAQALQGLQHHHRGDHLGRHRRMPTTLTRHIGKQLRWEQLVAVLGEEGMH
jgi:hypothetical protein